MQLLASGTVNYFTASVTPDGMWLLATAQGQDPAKRQLLRIPLSRGPAETILTASGPSDVQCARSGSRICILSETVGKQLVLSSVDAIRGRLGELARVETRGDGLWSSGLSPDGARIAVEEDSVDSVRVLDLKSRQLDVIHLTPPQAQLQSVAWSADGNRLFISGWSDLKGWLREMDLAGHTRLLLENPSGWLGGPLPSPDGKRIAYVYVVPESNVVLLEHF